MEDAHWNLTGRPFQLTPDPRFWFETATHRKAMAYLGYGLAQGEGFIVVTGDIGAGKTTLVGHLLETIDHQRLNAIRIVSTAIEAEDLLRIVADQLGVMSARLAKAELLLAIERGLHATARTGRRTLLIVDEAQALPVSAIEELRMLSNFQAGGHALLQIVLLGQPEFRDRLHGSDGLEQLRQRVIAIHHLDPMEEHEVADYIAHRLSVVGWRGRPDFAADAFAAFYAGSGGVPRRLNLLAGRVMLHAAIEQVELIDGATVRRVMGDLHADLPVVRNEPTILSFPAHPGESRGTGAVIEEAEAFQPSNEAHPGERRGPVAMSKEGADHISNVSQLDPGVRRDGANEQEGEADSYPNPDLHHRIAVLEQRIGEQDAALHRVLTLLVDWVEAEEPARMGGYAPIRSAAA